MMNVKRNASKFDTRIAAILDGQFFVELGE